MFEFMHKYRVPVLVVVLLGLVGFGAWGAIQNLFAKGAEDPIYGTFSVPGASEKVEVKWSEYRRTRLQLEGYGRLVSSQLGIRDNDPDLMAWDFIVAKKAAEVSGIPTSPEDGKELFDQIATMIRQNNPGAQLREFKDLPDADRELYRDIERAQRYLNVVQFGSLAGRDQNRGGDPGGGDYAAAFEKYKDSHERMRMGLAVIEGKKPSEFTLDMTKEEDKTKLLAFWNEKKATFIAQKPIAEQVTVEAVFVKHWDLDIPTFTKIFDEKYKAATADIEVTKEEILARWKASQESQDYKNILALEAKRREAAGENTGDQPDESAIVERRIEQELKIGKLLQRFAKEVNELSAAVSMKELAEKYGLQFERLENAESVDLNKNPDFGKPRWVLDVFRQGREEKLVAGKVVEVEDAKGKYLDGIFDQPGDMMAVIRPMEFKKRRDPELNDIRPWVIEQWQAEQAKKDREARTETFTKAITALVEQKIAAKQAEVDGKVKEAVDAFVEKEKLDREKDKETIDRFEQSERRKFDAELAAEKALHEKDAFLAVAKEQGVEYLESDWISFGPGQSGGAVTINDKLSAAEVRRRLFRSSRRINAAKAVQVGRMGSVDQEIQANLTVIPLVLEKEKPTVADMLKDPDLNRLLGQSAKTPPMFNYENIKSAAWFSLSAKETEAAIKSQQEREAERAARKARRDQAQAAQRRLSTQPVTPDAVKPVINPATGEPIPGAPVPDDVRAAREAIEDAKSPDGK